MRRSPLTDLLRNAYRTIVNARRTGAPIAEEFERAQADRRARALSRRELLQIGAATAGGLALAACGASASGDDLGSLGPDMGVNMLPTASVAVVGGGIAGVHCAYLLRKLGITCSLFEGSQRLGGRMFSDRDTFAKPDGQHCELGGELIDSGHTTLMDLSAALGIELYDYATDDPSLLQVVAQLGGASLTMQNILDGYAPIVDQVNLALGTLTTSDVTQIGYQNDYGAAPLDAMSIPDWFDSVGASGPVRALLDVAYNIEFGLETNQQSALNFLTLVGEDPATFEIFGSSDERFHTKTGNDTFVSKLAAQLDPAQINLGHELLHVAERPDGQLKLVFDRDGTTLEGTFQHVVLAIPFTTLRKVDLTGVKLPDVKAQAIQTLGYGTNAKLMVGFSSRPWRTIGKSNGSAYSDLRRLQSTWETSRLQPGPSGIITDYTGGKLGVGIGVGSPAAQAELFLDDFDKLYPGAKAAANGNVARMHWPTYRWTRGSYAAYLVGQWTGIGGAEIERVGNLHFAGEHCSRAFQGFMEGGAETGAQAAYEVAADLGAVIPDGGLAARTLPLRRILARAARSRRAATATG
jgi:monoamine oxidase